MAKRILPFTIVVQGSPTVIDTALWAACDHVTFDNDTDLWVHISAPIDRYIAPKSYGKSFSVTMPFSGDLRAVVKFEAPGTETQPAGTAGLICQVVFSQESEDTPASALQVPGSTVPSGGGGGGGGIFAGPPGPPGPQGPQGEQGPSGPAGASNPRHVLHDLCLSTALPSGASIVLGVGGSYIYDGISHGTVLAGIAQYRYAFTMDSGMVMFTVSWVNIGAIGNGNLDIEILDNGVSCGRYAFQTDGNMVEYNGNGGVVGNTGAGYDAVDRPHTVLFLITNKGFIETRADWVDGLSARWQSSTVVAPGHPMTARINLAGTRQIQLYGVDVYKGGHLYAGG